MREFSDADRKKKSRRIELPPNPGNLSPDALSRLEDAVRAAATEGQVPCPRAWRLALDAGVSRLDVGAMVDKLGLRVTDCQLGCFKVDKTAHEGSPAEPVDEEVLRRVETLDEAGELTCANVFALAAELGVAPASVADAANSRRRKFRTCQLGCF